MNKITNNVLPSILLLILIFSVCNNNETQSELKQAETEQSVSGTAKVTFVELGSVNCIPCKMMMPVMEAIEAEFGDQIKVVFHDVWKDPEPGRKYGIKLIPTQVFLDEAGNEFFRHQGFFSKEEIEKLLIDKGLKKIKNVEIKES